ncbi:translesion DNA synthesis-associated protein ImuA [Variovorax sp. GT1P44]|uniref:translesion DNA synthesis-associated protein ImuA n=1 Tax=Variovorax sp. GT1P44 TaxID=3443742 RepID=UPI003F475954
MGLPSFDSFSPSARHKVWRGDELGMADAQVIATGHAQLDAQLPGGGWPVGAMTELLLSAPEAHSWQLLLPALAKAVQAGTGPVALIGAPHEPFGPSLSAHGLPVEALLWVRSEAASARLWACEQALRCADVAAVLAWLPQARMGDLRRLQLAAAQHESLLFVLRPAASASSTSPARLRLQVALCEEDRSRLDVHILKRRGPPLASPIQLPACSERMAALLAASQLRRKLRRQQEGVLHESDSESAATVVRIDLHQGKRHALDRVALAAA